MRAVVLLAFVCGGCFEQHDAEVTDGIPRDFGCPAVDAATWTYLYDSYFGPDTPGHCGNAGCHDVAPKIGVPNGGWVCGATATSCYEGMLARTDKGRKAPLIDVPNPPASLLIDPVHSPLVWFSSAGIMPKDNAVPNDCAARDIPRWLVPDGGLMN